MKKVLVITYYWPPSGGAGVQRVLKFTKYLPQFGYKPYVVTVDEDQASYPAIDRTFEKDISPETEIFKTDTFEPFNLYSGLIGKKSIPTGFSNESDPGFVQKFSRFIRGNFFIPDARRGWVKFAAREASRLIESEKIDTVICTSPPHSAQLCGMYLKKKYNISWIADLRDPWTDIYYYREFYHLPYAKTVDRCLEKKVLETADAVITVSSELKSLFLSKIPGRSPDSVFVIPNGFDEEDFSGLVSNPGKGFVISYTGTLADSYKPEVFLKAFKKSVEKIGGSGLILQLIGNPSEGVMKQAEGLGIKNRIRFTPTVTHDKSVQMLLDSDALLLLIPDVSNDKGILTGKLFEYLASRKPIIALGPVDGDAAKIISECGAGRMFARNQADEISAYIDGLVSSKASGSGSDNRSDVFRKYSRREQSKALAGIIDTLSGKDI